MKFIISYYDQIQQGTIGMYNTLYGWDLQIIVLAYSFLFMHIIKVAFYNLLMMTQNNYKTH